MKLRDLISLETVGEPSIAQGVLMESPGTFHPPSLKNPDRVPADNPNDKRTKENNKYGDVDKRRSKATRKRQRELARHQQGNEGSGPAAQSAIATPVSSYTYVPFAFGGGPGSGRHAESGQFKKVGKNIQRTNKENRFVTFYKSPSGSYVNVTRVKLSEGRGTRKGSNKSMANDRFTVHQARDGSEFGKKVHSGDTTSAQKFLKDKYGITHSI